MILCDTEIEQEVKAKRINITPFDRNMIQPASYDLKVGEDAATVPSNGNSRINLKKEKVLVLPAFSPAVVWTLEELKFPLDIAGRFGLKSGLSRRGVYASVGPQIDPGFDGKLSVTLFNLTPTPLSLNYKDRFLTMEIHRLGRAASKGYEGEYQRRKTFTSRELDPILGFEGHHGLGDVVKGFDAIHDKLEAISSLGAKFDSFLKSYENQNRDLVASNKALVAEMKKLVDYMVGEHSKTLVLRTVTKDQAKQEILALFKKKKKQPLFYSDIAETLKLDLELVVELCHELERLGQIGVLPSHETK